MTILSDYLNSKKTPLERLRIFYREIDETIDSQLLPLDQKAQVVMPFYWKTIAPFLRKESIVLDFDPWSQYGDQPIDEVFALHRALLRSIEKREKDASAKTMESSKFLDG